MTGWTWTQEYELRSAWYNGEPLESLARHYGLTPAGMSNKIRRLGLKRRPKNFEQTFGCRLCRGTGEIFNKHGLFDACPRCAVHAETDFQAACNGGYREAAE